MSLEMWPGVIEAYREFMPVTESTPIITLREGNTPLIPAPELQERIGLPIPLYLKYEGMNPTGSFKDRGMTVAVTKAVEEGQHAVMCASTGNTAAAAAAYAARAGIDCVVVLPLKYIAMGKIAQSVMHGAKVVAIEGNFDDAFRIVVEITSNYPVQLVNSINPYRIEGQKSGSFEICDVLGRGTDLSCDSRGQRGQHYRLLEGLRRIREGRPEFAKAEDAGLPGRGRGADRTGRTGRRSADAGHRHQDRQSRRAGSPRSPRGTNRAD